MDLRGFADLITDQNFLALVDGLASFSKKDILARRIFMTMKFLKFLYLEKWSLEWERLNLLKSRSRLAISFLISLLIQGVGDLIGTLLLGIHLLMMDMNSLDHFRQNRSMSSAAVATGKALSN